MAKAAKASAAPAKAEATKQYEGMFLFPASASTELEKSITTARGIIERHKGKVQVIKKWDERKLAYELGGQKRGLFVISYFTGPGDIVSAIERDVNLSEEILRVLVTHADHLNETEMAAVEPQPIQPREERQPWDRPPMGGYDDRGDRRPPRRDDRPEPAAAKD
ncbi:MAG TPA: 30S ribosomal protein S6 [Tepidisphaeraceae bacterium]|jgi:small subunit ribosomal protein S6